MYICLCNAIKDSELRELARGGVREAERAYEALDCEPHCATCTDYVQAVLDEVATGGATA